MNPSFLTKQPILIRLGHFLLKTFGWGIYYLHFNNRYGLEVNVRRPLLPVMARVLQSHYYFRFQTVSDMVGLDYPQLKQRFRVVNLFLSYTNTLRLFLSVWTDEKTPLQTLTSWFPGCGWLEREVWDFFGIYFQGNRDLRRILTDYGFSGFPLRKDFPLTGFFEVFYEDRRAQVVSRPVSLAQEYRDFTHQNPWREKK